MKQHNIDESLRNANNRNPQRYHGRHSLIYFLCIACLFFLFPGTYYSMTWPRALFYSHDM